MAGRCPRRGAADVRTYEAQVEALERGAPLAGMTLAESIAHLASLAIATDWPTPQERERARGLALRLAALGWRCDAGPGRGARLTGPPGKPGAHRTASTKR